MSENRTLSHKLPPHLTPRQHFKLAPSPSYCTKRDPSTSLSRAFGVTERIFRTSPHFLAMRLIISRHITIVCLCHLTPYIRSHYPTAVVVTGLPSEAFITTGHAKFSRYFTAATTVIISDMYHTRYAGGIEHLQKDSTIPTLRCPRRGRHTSVHKLKLQIY